MIIDPNIFAVAMGFAASTGWCMVRIIRRKSRAEGAFHIFILLMLLVAAIIFKKGIAP